MVLEISQILQNQQKTKMADLALLYSLKAQVVIEVLTLAKYAHLANHKGAAALPKITAAGKRV